MSGSFDIVVDYGGERERFHLNGPTAASTFRPWFGGRSKSFSTNSVCLVLASEFYDIQDYVDVHDDFLKAAEQTAP